MNGAALFACSFASFCKLISVTQYVHKREHSEAVSWEGYGAVNSMELKVVLWSCEKSGVVSSLEV